MVRSGRIRSTFIKRIRRIPHSAILGVGYLITVIVNNDNILTDGRRYRKRPKIEM